MSKFVGLMPTVVILPNEDLRNCDAESTGILLFHANSVTRLSSQWSFHGKRSEIRTMFHFIHDGHRILKYSYLPPLKVSISALYHDFYLLSKVKDGIVSAIPLIMCVSTGKQVTEKDSRRI